MADKVAIVVPNIPQVPKALANDANRQVAASRGSNTDIRRPLDGIELADDTYATISLLSGGELLNTSVAAGVSASNANLMVQSISFSVSEKHQRAQTFDTDRLFFFGQTLPSLRLEAITLDTPTFQWLQELYENYVSKISGSVSAESATKVQITSDDRVYTGYILEMSFTKSSQVRATANVSMSMSLTNLTHLSSLKSTFFGGLGGTDNSAALASISESLTGSEGPADSSIPLALQVPLASTETQSATSSDVPLSAVYVNEYPYRESRRSTTSSRSTLPPTRNPDVLSSITQNIQAIIGLEQAVLGQQPDIIALPEIAKIIAERDVAVPSVTPVSNVVSASSANARIRKDDEPSLESLGINLAEGDATAARLRRVR